jgi:hypothetical protein
MVPDLTSVAVEESDYVYINVTRIDGKQRAVLSMEWMRSTCETHSGGHMTAGNTARCTGAY